MCGFLRGAMTQARAFKFFTDGDGIIKEIYNINVI